MDAGPHRRLGWELDVFARPLLAPFAEREGRFGLGEAQSQKETQNPGSQTGDEVCGPVDAKAQVIQRGFKGFLS